MNRMRGPIVVAGGTGNVGAFVVSELLRRGVTVAVPSRSDEKLAALRAFLGRQGTPADRLVTFEGDITREADAREFLARLENDAGPLAGALASLGKWRSAASLLSADPEDLQAVLDGYLFAHYRVARNLLPSLRDRGGSYVLVNGPLAFAIWPGTGSAFVSMATAAQHMLFQALAQELQGTEVQVAELVSHAFIRNREAQPGSPLSGEAVGSYAAHLLSGAADAHGRSIRLRSYDQMQDVTDGQNVQ